MSRKQPSPLPPPGHKRPDLPPATHRPKLYISEGIGDVIVPREYAPIEVVYTVLGPLIVPARRSAEPRKRVSWRDPRFGWA